MEAVRGGLGGLVEAVTQSEWESAAAPGHNPIGFTAWHVPSIQDWALNTWMRNAPTVRSRPEWEAKGMMTSFLPVGMGLAAAQEVARATKPEDVLAYADAVLAEARVLLNSMTAEKFDEIPPNKLHFADSRYDAPGYLADVSDMYEQRYWRLFLGACTGHCRGHLGELELGLELVRGR